jgi:hypothetical protein
MGTLYTCAYDVRAGAVEYRWPGVTWSLALESFVEGVRTITLATPSAA